MMGTHTNAATAGINQAMTLSAAFSPKVPSLVTYECPGKWPCARRSRRGTERACRDARGGDRFERHAYTIREGDSWCVAEQLAGKRDVRARVSDIARSLCCEPQRHPALCLALDGCHEVEE